MELLVGIFAILGYVVQGSIYGEQDGSLEGEGVWGLHIICCSHRIHALDFDYGYMYSTHDNNIHPRNLEGVSKLYIPERSGVNQPASSDSGEGREYGDFQAPGVPGVEPNIRKDISATSANPSSTSLRRE